MRYFACAQYDRDFALIRVLKGVRGISPNTDSAACGKQVDFQGAAGGKILAKIAKELFGERAESERGDNSAICSRRSIPHLCSVRGDEADRRRWRIKGSGGRENNERTRGHLCRRRARQLFFRGRRPGEPPRYTRMTGSCFCFAKPLCRYASPRFWFFSQEKNINSRYCKQPAYRGCGKSGYTV